MDHLSPLLLKARGPSRMVAKGTSAGAPPLPPGTPVAQAASPAATKTGAALIVDLFSSLLARVDEAVRSRVALGELPDVRHATHHLGLGIACFA